MMVLRKMMDVSVTDREKAITWLLIGAIFFAMRSCEYLKTTQEESKRTRIVRVGNIVFKKGNILLSHNDPNLADADLVRIRFVFQKNDKRDVQVHMFRSGDELLCPVIAWASTVKRVRSIPSASDNTEVCQFIDNKNKITLLQASNIRTRLRSIVNLIGKEILGFEKDDIGLHSIRSGGAMAMFLAGVSVIVIQRVGRWSSEAFLEYIRDQVEAFTLNVSKDMLRFEEFLNLATENNTETATVGNTTETTENEDGPEVVPFTVRFNDLSLTNEN